MSDAGAVILVSLLILAGLAGWWRAVWVRTGARIDEALAQVHRDH